MNAQSINKDISGMVTDSSGVALKGVNIRLTSTLDTFTVATNALGTYSFKNVRGKDLRLSYSMISYQIATKNIPNFDGLLNILVPTVRLMPQTSYIPEVKVTKIIPIIYKDDTTQYNLAAYSFRKNSLLEESLKQMGFQVMRDGSVYSNGKIITSVKVDGKKFFGGDVITATRNLPTDFIKYIQVIDTYGDFSEQSGIKTNEPEKIINIVLKEDSKRILFGQMTAGGGTSSRFIGSVGINKFNDGQEFSVVGSINNTNTSLFTYGSPNGVGGRESSMNDIGDYSDPTDGLNNTKALGFSFSDKLSDNTNVSGGYNFINRNNVTEGNSQLTSYYYGYKILTKDEYVNKTNDFQHRINLEFDTRFKNKDILKISPILSYSYSKANSEKNTDLQNRTITNKGIYLDSTITNNPNAELNVFYSKHFNKPKRKLVANLNVNANSFRTNDQILEENIIIDSATAIPSISHFNQRQFVISKNETNTAKASFSYVEPFFEHSLLELAYNIDVNQINSFRQVQQPYIHTVLDSTFVIDSLGVNYNYLYSSNKTSLNYQYEPNNKFRVNIGFGVQPLTLTGKLPNYGDSTYTYNNINLIPSAMMKYRFNDEFDWQINYQGQNNEPNFLYILPIIDNSNSRNIIIGNPELKAEFVNKISTTFRKSISSKSQYLEANLAYNFIRNKIVTDKSADGVVQSTTYRNTDGYYDVKGFYVFNSPFINDNFQLDLNGNVDYYNYPSFVNSYKTSTQQILSSHTLQLRYNYDQHLETVFATNYFVNNAVYQQPAKSSITTHSYLLSLGTKGYLNDYVTIGAETSQRFYSGYDSDVLNVNPTIINAYIEFTFLQNKMALLRFQGFDLLDQNKNIGIYTEYIGNDLYEARNNRLGRYFMVTLNMRLQKFPKK
ncbi:TonB-dependent receptor [Sphingobacterium hungaricum]